MSIPIIKCLIENINVTDYNLACVDMYCDRLIDRTFAKEVVHDYQLMDKYFFSSEKPKRRLTQEEKYVLDCVPYALSYILKMSLFAGRHWELRTN